MLIYKARIIEIKPLAIRKKRGMTQAEVAEAAGLSDRAYAEIERGTVNMRVDTILRICGALDVTPDDILTDESNSLTALQEELFDRLSICSVKDRKAALSILSIFLKVIE